MWGMEISVTHHTIKAKYRYDHTHDTASIKEILKVLTGANEARDRRKAPAPGERQQWSAKGWRAYASWCNDSRVSPWTVLTWRAHMQQPTARTGARAGAGAKATTGWTKRQCANPCHPRPPLVPPLHHLRRGKAGANIERRAATERKMRKGNKIPQAANTAPNKAAMVTRTQRQRTTHMTNATSTPSTKVGGRSGYATRWKSSTRSGTNLSIDGVGIGPRRRWNNKARF